MPHPPIAQSITWVYTDDLAGTAGFYGTTLGLSLALDQGSCRVFHLGPSGFLGVCQVRPGRHVEPKGVVITIVTPDVDAWHAHVVARGITPLAPPEHRPGFQAYGFFARDPNGYLLEFQSFQHPDWPATQPTPAV